jgi:undecaprenyl-diphosphatase
VYFRQDLWRVAITWLRSLRDPSLRSSLDARMGWYIIVGTIPISVFGLAFQGPIETTARDLYLIGTMLVVLGIVLYLADHTASRRRDIEGLTMRDGILIGFAQALALIPGVSRSGATMSAGLLLGFDRASAARYSFLLSVPAVVLSGLFQLGDIGGEGSAPAVPTAIATVLAFVSGYASIAFLLKFLVTHTFDVFVIYRIGLGVLVLALAASGAIA